MTSLLGNDLKGMLRPRGREGKRRAHRTYEQVLHLPVKSRGKAKDCLDRIPKEINRAGQDAPELNVRLWKREAKRFGVKEPLDLP